MVKHYIEFIYSGLLTDETGDLKEIPDRDINKIKLPERAIGFSIFDRVEVEQLCVICISDPINRDNYYKGIRLTLEDVKRGYPDSIHAIKNMENSNCDAVRIYRGGMLHPLYENDHVIE